MPALANLVRVSVLAALVASGPAMAQKQSLADRVLRLEQQSASQSSVAGQSNVDLLNRLTQMQAEVQALRNQVEQLQNDNEQFKQTNRDQYIHLDSRLQRIEGGASAPSLGSGSSSGASVPQTPTANGAAGPVPGIRDFEGTGADAQTDMAGSTRLAGEQETYAGALNVLQSGDYVVSARAFQAFLRDYPDGALAANAWYWLGESYYATRNFQVALQSFDTLLTRYPDAAKAPDAMLKKGYCQIELGDAATGRQTLDGVIARYPGTDAARLAATRLRALSLQAR